jgi:hypothetical protein
VLLAVLFALLTAFAAPATAESGDKVKTREVFSIPEDLALIEDPGELNHGCSVGLYTLVDGTMTKKVTSIYSPSLDAWEQQLPGATLTQRAEGFLRGVFDNDATENLYGLKQNGKIRVSFTFDTSGGFFAHWEWTGEFFDLATGEVSDWWVFDVYTDGITATGISDGTCGGLEIWLDD